MTASGSVDAAAETGCWKKHQLEGRIWEANAKNDFSKPRGLGFVGATFNFNGMGLQ